METTVISNFLAKVLNLAQKKHPIDTGEIEGKSIGIDIQSLPHTIGLTVRDGQFQASTFEDADVTMTGSFRAFVTMINNEDALDSDELLINGKLQAAKRYQKVFSSLQLDWEKLLASFLPDGLAERGAEHIQIALGLGKQFIDDLTQGLSDYVIYEKKLVVNQDEYRHFQAHLNDTIERVERLLKHVQQQS